MAVVLEILVERQSEESAHALEAEEFAQLYRRTYAPLVEHCRKRLGAGDDAEDIAQAALLRAWDCWDSYDKSRPFWPWVVTIARRLAIDTYRRAARQDVITTTVQDEPASVSPEDEVSLRADAALALAALRQLRPQDQRLIGLRDLEGWSYDELARFEGESVDLVRRHTHRARLALRASYLRVSQQLAGLAVGGWAVRARRRLSLSAARAPMVAPAGPALDSGVQVLSGLAVLVLAVSVGTPAAVDRDPVPLAASSAAAPAEVASETESLPGTPTAASPTSASQSVMQELGIDTVAVPEDAAFDSFSPAPDGHTVFATGTGNGTCSAARCPAIFVSRDAGRTWQRLAGQGYAGGALLVPPAYPADSRLFAAGPLALQVSNDGGESFIDITTVGGPAAMSPEFSAGDPRILVGAAPGWVYDDRDKSMRPLTSATSLPSLTRTFAFSPAFKQDGRLLVGGTSSPLGGADVSTVSVCGAAGCPFVSSLSGLRGAPALLVSPQYAQDGIVFAWRPNGLYRSADGGVSFQQVPLPTRGAVESVVPAGRSGFLLTMRPQFSPAVGGGLFMSTDGVQWRALPGLPDGIVSAALVGDRLLAGPSWRDGGGLRCSSDGGATWRPRCD